MPDIDIIGVPIDYGAGRHGVRLGPDAVREAGLVENLKKMGLSVHDRGNVAVPEAEESTRAGHKPRFVTAVRSANEHAADEVERSARAGHFPLVIGGDHSMAIGVLAGMARARGPQGLIWIDAHADLNTPSTSPTGNIHGMSVAVALGEAQSFFPPDRFPAPSIDAKRCVFIGLRDLDPAERKALHDRGFTCFTMSDIDRLGMGKVIEEALAVACRGQQSVHVSLDIDSLDPSLAPGTGTPVPGGLTYREAHLAMEMIAESGCADSLEVAEVNPVLDEHNRTATIAVELICSALGKTIL
ncbi:MAG: arginase [Candidatus Eremiobacteraeota bacterium]|nr:arginase [Candidatus Eremiobacteraeota bacterium]